MGIAIYVAGQYALGFRISSSPSFPVITLRGSRKRPLKRFVFLPQCSTVNSNCRQWQIWKGGTCPRIPYGSMFSHREPSMPYHERSSISANSARKAKKKVSRAGSFGRWSGVHAFWYRLILLFSGFHDSFVAHFPHGLISFTRQTTRSSPSERAPNMQTYFHAPYRRFQMPCLLS
jgi:hypothetical protein